MDSSSRPIVIRALCGETTARTPVWMMRQAGRSDPEYRSIRERVPLPLEQLFADVDLAVEISLLPKRIGVDAVIFFQDILTPLGPMGAAFKFRPGPELEHPVTSPESVRALRNYDVAAELPFVGTTLSRLSSTLDRETALLGFAGAPLTLLYFMVEGKSPGQGTHAESFLRNDPALAHELLAKLADLTVDYLKYQIASGAQAVQLFESVADVVPSDLYEEFARGYQQQVFEGLGNATPRILFAKGIDDLARVTGVGADAYSLSSGVHLSCARTFLGPRIGLQGNVPNKLLAEGSRDEIARAVHDCVVAGNHTGHVLNLDHGILQHTPWENVEWLVECAKREIQIPNLHTNV